MAKKKVHPIKAAIVTPFVPRYFLSFLLVGALFMWFNLYTFRKFEGVKEKQTAIISQTELLNVLGSSISLGDQPTPSDNPLLADPQAKYWYSVVKEKPTFRDAHLILAALAYNKYQCQIAQSHFATALSLDPNITGYESLKSALSHCGK